MWLKFSLSKIKNYCKSWNVVIAKEYMNQKHWLFNWPKVYCSVFDCVRSMLALTVDCDRVCQFLALSVLSILFYDIESMFDFICEIRNSNKMSKVISTCLMQYELFLWFLALKNKLVRLFYLYWLDDLFLELGSYFAYRCMETSFIYTMKVTSINGHD